MRFQDLIAVRRSHRKFTEEPVSDEQLRLLERAALIAPTGHSLHAASIVVVRDGETIAQLAECKQSGSQFAAEAPLVIAVVGDPRKSDTWMEDACIAATHILLQAEDLGLGACWVEVKGRAQADGTPAEDVVRGLLALPQELQPICLLPIGHKGMERKPQNEERLLWTNVHEEYYTPQPPTSRL